MADAPTIHASAVLIGAKAVLIRGPSGAGKSRLAWDLISSPALPFARLVADDRAHVEAHHGRLLVRPAPSLAGLLEVRGLGIRQVPYEPVATVGTVIDLAAADAVRHPERTQTTVEGIALPRLAAGPGMEPLAMLLALWRSAPPAD